MISIGTQNLDKQNKNKRIFENTFTFLR